ncbi:MAG: SUMF1/EgtB/PvdO family nonheme iron enzyme [Polyangiaceae bacterium]
MRAWGAARSVLACLAVAALSGASRAADPGPSGSQSVALEHNAPCPEEMVLVGSATCVDRFEASLVRVEADGRDGEPFPPNKPVYPNTKVRAVSLRGALPQAYISQLEAARACAASNKRLCTDTEWVAACEGIVRAKYPYGERRRAGACNDRGVEPMAAVFGKPESALVWGFEEMNDPRLYLVTGAVARTGQFTRCLNDYGLADMVGNLHEWTSDPEGTMRGGYYLDTQELGEGCRYAAVGHDVRYHDYSTGFRCCKDSS